MNFKAGCAIIDLGWWSIELKKRIDKRRLSRHFVANYAQFNRIRTNIFSLKNRKSSAVLIQLLHHGDKAKITYVMLSKENSDFTITSNLIRRVSVLKFTFNFFKCERKSRNLILTSDVSALLNQ